ncbi:hypothetical protein C8Q73DRAFT_699123 [Cubamyces lactineus]|nr:hypothetical protein C8Q73DRAFT_699123 [Cubamyces lactineus]
MSVINEDPAADAMPTSAAAHPSGVNSDQESSAPSNNDNPARVASGDEPRTSPDLADGNSTTAHATSLPDAEPHAHALAQAAARTDADAVQSQSTNPFFDTDEPTPALPPRPDEDTMTATVAAPLSTHANPGADNTEEQAQVSPQVASLRSMFPDFDVTVLQSVLDSVNGDQERAVDILLGMSDPEYVSTQQGTTQAEQPSLDLDEQLARQLMLEDQQQQQRHATGNSWPRRDQINVPYQARRSPEGQPRPPPAERRTDLEELQRTMGQIAESGKRTFSSIVSKVKAKINEYETSRNTGQSSNTVPQWGSAPPTQLDRHTASQAYQQHYYGEPEPSPALEPPISLSSPPASQPRGYDLDAPPVQPTPVHAVPAASSLQAPGGGSPGRATTPPSAATQQRSPAASPRPSGDVPRPPPTSSGSPVNAAKIGLLPKRPVSLLNANSPPPTRPSDDDDLEYAENPFEEHK